MNDEDFIVQQIQPFITCNQETKNLIMKEHRQIQKLNSIINLEVGWSSPRVLIDTIKREVFEE